MILGRSCCNIGRVSVKVPSSLESPNLSQSQSAKIYADYPIRTNQYLTCDLGTKVVYDRQSSFDTSWQPPGKDKMLMARKFWESEGGDNQTRLACLNFAPSQQTKPGIQLFSFLCGFTARRCIDLISLIFPPPLKCLRDG